MEFYIIATTPPCPIVTGGCGFRSAESVVYNAGLWCKTPVCGAKQRQDTTKVGQWSNNLFGCFSNPKLCIFSYLLPCYTFGSTAETIGEGSCLTCGLALMIPGFNIYTWVQMRGKIREMKGIEGSPLNDILTIVLCGPCALVQEASEVNASTGPSAQSMSRY